MNKTLTALYDSFYTPPQSADTRAEIKTIHTQLILKLDKPERRVKPVELHYSGFAIPDAFVVGYGLDYSEKYRNLPYIGILKPQVYGA